MLYLAGGTAVQRRRPWRPCRQYQPRIQEACTASLSRTGFPPEPTASLPTLYEGLYSSVGCQQQQYLDIDPEGGQEVKSPLEEKNKYLGENNLQWLRAHSGRTSPGKPQLCDPQNSPPTPQSRGEPGAARTHNRALKFYAEEHHVGAKRFYGDTFGLHIGVLGTKKTSCKWASASALGELLLWELPYPLRLGKPGAVLPALPSSS